MTPSLGSGVVKTTCWASVRQRAVKTTTAVPLRSSEKFLYQPGSCGPSTSTYQLWPPVTYQSTNS